MQAVSAQQTAQQTTEGDAEPRRQRPPARRASGGRKAGKTPVTMTPVKAVYRTAVPPTPARASSDVTPPVATPLQVETWRTPAQAPVRPSSMTPPAPPCAPPAPLEAPPPPPAPPPPAPPWHRLAAPALPPGSALPPGVGNGAGRIVDSGSGSLLISTLRCNALPSPTRASHGRCQGKWISSQAISADCATTDRAGCLRTGVHSPLQAKRLACDVVAAPATQGSMVAAPATQGRQEAASQEAGTLPRVAVDQALAMALQATAYHQASSKQGTQFSLESPSTTQSYSSVLSDRRLSDPVWGDLEFVGRSPTGCQRFWFGFCPCLVIGCGGGMRCCAAHQQPIDPESARRAWKRFLLSFATAISFLQVVALIIVLAVGNGFVPWSKNMMWGPHPYFLDAMGAKNVARILVDGEWWRLLTPLLLHSGVLHLGANAFVQIRMGLALEVLWGHRRWLQIYLISGVYSVVASCLFLPNTISVGSSGAICGLVGAEIVYIILTWRQTLPRDIAERNTQMASFFLTFFVTGGLSFLPMVDFAAHAGGFIAGVLLSLVMFADRLKDCDANVHFALQAFGLVALCFMVCASGAYLALRTEADHALLHLCQPPDC